MDPGKCKALLDWVNSTGIETHVENFSQLADGVVVAEVVKHMQILPKEPCIQNNDEKPWVVIEELLKASNLRSTVQHIEWPSLEIGNENEIAKVILLLLSLSISCPNKEKLILEMTNLDYETQNHIRHILTEALNEGIPSPHNLFDLMTLKAPSSEQLELDFSDSPARNSPLAPATSVNSVNESPLILHNRSIQNSNRGIFRTPVKQIFRSLEEEEVYFSVPASCPPLRRGGNTRHALQDMPSFNASAECSPMQEFLASPVINYRIKIRDLDQKLTVLDKNLHAERVAKEEIQKILLEKEAAFEKMQKKIREMSRCSIDKQRLFDEIDELHAVKLERDSLEKENSKLKHRLEKFDTYSNESKDLKRDLDSQLKQNEELLKQIKALKNSLDKVSQATSQANEIEETLKTSQERNTLQEQEISHLLTQLHKLKSQNIEQKEHYESRITDYKSMIEDKDSSCVENEGESMGIFMEHRVLELQETVKEMEESWIKPDIAAKMQSDLDVTKETMENYRTKLHSVGGEKMTLEEELCQLQQELTSKTGEIMDSLKKLSAANQKLKNSDSAVEALRAKSEALSGDKESLKKRIRELETDLKESNSNIGKLQVELNLTKNENDDKAMLIESHIRRLSDSSNKIVNFEQQCCALESTLSEKERESVEKKREYEAHFAALQKTITENRNQISEFEEKINMLEKDEESSKSEIGILTQDVFQEKQNLSEAKQETKLIREEVKRYHAACAELEENCKILNIKLNDARTNSEKTSRIKEEEIAKLHHDEESFKTQLIDLQEDLDLKTSKLYAIKEKFDESEICVRNLENERENLLKEKEDLGLKLDDNLKDRANLKTELNEAITEIEASKETCENLNSELRTLHDNFDKNTKEKEELRLKMEELIVESTNLKTELDRSVAELKDSRGSCETFKSELMTLKEDFEAKKKENGDAFDVFHQKLTDEENRYSNLKNDFEKSKNASDELQNETSCLRQQVRDLQTCMEEWTLKKDEEQEEHEQNMILLKSQINDQEKRCVEYVTAIENLTQEIEGWKEKIEEVENQHQEDTNETNHALLRANDLVENHLTTISELENDLKGKMQNHKDEIKCKENELGSLRSMLTNVENENQVIQNELDALRYSSASQIQQLVEDLNTAQKEHGSLKNCFRESDDSVKNLAIKLGEAEGLRMEQQKLIEDVQTQYREEIKISVDLRNKLEESEKREHINHEESENLKKVIQDVQTQYQEEIIISTSLRNELVESRTKEQINLEKLENLRKSIENVQTQYQDEVKSSANLQNELGASKRREHEKLEEFQNLQNKILAGITENDCLKSKLQESEIKVNETEQRISEIIKNLDSAKESESLVSQELKNAEICNAQITEEHKMLSEKFESLNLENQKLGKEISLREDSLKKLKRDMKMEEENLHLRIKELEEDITSLNQDAEKDAMKHKDELIKVSDSLQQKEESFKANLEEKDQKVEEMLKCLSDITKEKENYQKQVEKLEELNKIADVDIKAFKEKQEEDARNYKDELIKVSDSLQQKEESFKANLEEKDQKVEAMLKCLSDITKEKENYLKQVEKLEELNKIADVDISAFKEKQEEDARKMQQLTGKVKLLEAQIDVDNVARDETVAELLRVKLEVETSEKLYRDDIKKFTAAVTTLEENLQKSEEKCSTLEEDSMELAKLKASFSDLEIENVKLLEDFTSSQRCHDSEKDSAQNKMQKLEDDHCIQVTALEERLKEVGEENDKLKKELESVVEIMNSMKEFYEVKMKTNETESTKAKQEFDFLKVENETLQKSNDDLIQKHLDEITKSQSTTDKTLKLLENEKERYATLEGRLKKEVLGTENELSQARNSLKLVSEEKLYYEKQTHDIEKKHSQTLSDLQQAESRFNIVQLENSELRISMETFKDEKEKADEKVKVIRTQFAEKYRAKQERILKLEQDLKDWQTRADEQTNKYDNIAARFKEGRTQLNETVNNLDQVREENLDLQEAVRNLKTKNELLANNRSQLNVQKMEEEKKIRQLSAENQRLSTQLQFAERQIRQLRTDSHVPFRHSTLLSEPLNSVEEDSSSTSSRRRSLDISADDMFSGDNLFRCRSDTFLDSPSTANKKARRNDQDQLNDSLDDILRTPVNLHTRSKTQKQNAAEKHHRNGNHDDDRRPTDQSHMSIESSLLSDTPSCRKSRCFSQSHPQLNLNMSQTSHDSADINMNSSNLAEASFVANDSSRGSAGQRSGIARHPSSLAFQTEEEPEDYEWGSLSRLAELQRRNAATLPHLKSSYPIETQGQTPGRSDETVRVGDADGTMRRMTQTSATLQRSLAAAANEFDARSRRMTIDVNSDLMRRHELSRRPLSSVSENATLPKRKNSNKDNSSDNIPLKNRRGGSETEYDLRSRKPEQNQWNGVIQMEPEEKEQVDPRSRMSMMFEIPNSPRKPALRSRTTKKSTTSEKIPNTNAPSTSKRISSLMKTPDKSKTAKKNTEEKRRTPSLMDRVKKPLGRFNSKK